MSRNYKFYNPEALYFISFAVVGWLDLFIRNEYKNLFVESLIYCQKEKGLEIHAWCIMTSHIHLVFRSFQTTRKIRAVAGEQTETELSIEYWNWIK